MTAVIAWRVGDGVKEDSFASMRVRARSNGSKGGRLWLLLFCWLLGVAE
jgi:hypothetical protein